MKLISRSTDICDATLVALSTKTTYGAHTSVTCLIWEFDTLRGILPYSTNPVYKPGKKTWEIAQALGHNDPLGNRPFDHSTLIGKSCRVHVSQDDAGKPYIDEFTPAKSNTR